MLVPLLNTAPSGHILCPVVAILPWIDTLSTSTSRKIVAGLEGGIAAGKSTAGRLMTGHGYHYVREYMSYLDPAAHSLIGGWPQQFRLKFFMDVDNVRRASSAHATKIALDRTFLSIIAHDYALLSLGKKVDISYYKSIDPNAIWWPSAVAFFRITDTERMRRLHTRNYKPESYLADPAFNQAIESFFRGMRHVMKICWLDSSSHPSETLARSLATCNALALAVPPPSDKIMRHALRMF